MNHSAAANALSFALAFAAPVLGAEPRIERMAPDTSFVVVSVKSLATLTEHGKNTKLWELWQSPELADVRTAVEKKYTKAVEDVMKEIGVEGQALPWPTGSVGLAMFPLLNEDLGTNEPGFLWAADYGVDADRAAALVDAIFKRGQESGKVVLDDEDVLGRKVYTVQPREAPPQRGEQGGEEDPMRGPGARRGAERQDNQAPDEEIPSVEDMLADIPKIHYVRVANVLMASNDMRGLTRAIESLDGGDVRCIGEDRTFQRMAAQFSESDAFGLLLVDNLASMFSGEMAEAAMVLPMVKSVLGNITGLGAGLRLDAGLAMTDASWAVYMPDGVSGITSLLDTQSRRTAPPAFVPPDAISYSRVNFEFEGLMGVIREFIKTNAMLMPMDPEQLMAALESEVRPLTSSLGSEMHTVTTTTGGGEEGGPGKFYAIRSDRMADVQAYMTAHAPQMGIEAREFLGHMIYTIDLGPFLEMMPMPLPMTGDSVSIGLGASYVFIGNTRSVEGALRAGGAAGAAGGLAETPMFQHAVAALGDEPVVGWGFSNVVAQLEASREAEKAMRKKWMQEAGIQDEDQFLPPGAKDEPFYKLSQLDAKVLQRYIGPAAWQFTSTGEGFLGKGYLLPPAE